MGRRPLIRRAVVVAAVALLFGLVGVVAYDRFIAAGSRSALRGARLGPESDARAPDGVRVRVEVLNASTVRGLARRATLHLRDRGFDVVYTGSASERNDSTLVLDRSGHPDWARLAAAAMGGGRVESRPDTLRYVDLTILVGAIWR
ncbi:MAG: LytR C-terminal domain-containing protein, partial [Gemmatimonadota bacterium]|nr:LytR C-terminal domain-containing protein [Gemmatimonadota bacterium]